MNQQLLQELKTYIEKNLIKQSIVSESGIFYERQVPYEVEEPFQKFHRYKCTPSEEELKDYIRKTKREETFSSRLLKYIDMMGLKDAEIYKRACIDRRHFSKIRCDKNYRPKKLTAVALCLALELDAAKTDDMLELAGYSLSNSDTGDLVIKFCIEKGIYNLIDVNEALDYFGQKGIGVVG